MAWDRIIGGKTTPKDRPKGLRDVAGVQGLPKPKGLGKLPPKPPLHLPKLKTDDQAVRFFVTWMGASEPTKLAPGLRAELIARLRVLHLRSQLLSSVMKQLGDKDWSVRKIFIVNMLRGCWLRLLPDPPKPSLKPAP